ncbi:MAG: hypothetical protein GX494_07195 [Clostridiaceae bacterium]|nr:hypothetical protein [Clostridiaceae bacterium]
MEYSRTEWDLFLWPRTWHNRLNPVASTLIPGIVIVGLFDMLTSSETIIAELMSASRESGFVVKILAFIIISALIGFIDVFCFAWPIADLCRYLAKRSEKYITPGFNIIFMKSYAFSHIYFLPLIVYANYAAFRLENIGPETPFISKLLITLLVIMAYTQRFWQLGIMLRTIGVKSKLELPGKLIAAAAMFFWSSITVYAFYYLISIAHKLLNEIAKIT